MIKIIGVELTPGLNIIMRYYYIMTQYESTASGTGNVGIAYQIDYKQDTPNVKVPMITQHAYALHTGNCGAGVIGIYDTSDDNCARMCSQNPKCAGFSYNRQLNKCILRSDTSYCSKNDIVNDQNSFDKFKNDSSNVNKFVFLEKFPKYKTSINTEHPEYQPFNTICIGNDSPVCTFAF